PSSSRALIGGVVGSAVAAVGFDAILAEGLMGKVLIPAILAPVLAFLVAGVSIGVSYRIIGKQRPGVVPRGYPHGQPDAGGLRARAQPTNAAQKRGGVIPRVLPAPGRRGPCANPPLWVIASSAAAI